MSTWLIVHLYHSLDVDRCVILDLVGGKHTVMTCLNRQNSTVSPAGPCSVMALLRFQGAHAASGSCLELCQNASRFVASSHSCVCNPSSGRCSSSGCFCFGWLVWFDFLWWSLGRWKFPHMWRTRLFFYFYFFLTFTWIPFIPQTPSWQHFSPTPPPSQLLIFTSQRVQSCSFIPFFLEAFFFSPTSREM